ncbi:serine/threonine protein kinase Nek3, putative [Entamoeba invadens IP1]|uniref:non-specific serine/threonine protein kinase n=1 Tax=Entamoeba invadens IP1 TaxID=370355 RepID=A0A0A1UEL6_ENTIV|nr:serine/threonine protein kinase Nek3, putative [Entamoeba invadens IP1]ELP95016.1 serine/threonine protein kinase Nek3, putative [Entamoeba invadens IP1]|eukprot:XP_004261787.1 serine/threonine protein kinase Nek3, putative [Entamoeba invadens IP1]
MIGTRASSYKIYKKLGQGGFGQVFLGRDLEGHVVVVKKIPIDDDNRDKATNEVKIMKRVCHSNLIHFIDSFVNRKNLVIIMEYARGGDLSRFIKKRMGEQLPEDLVWNIFLQINFGLAYLHSVHILHRDLKTQNIFLMADGTVKIGDFGIGRMLAGDDESAHTVIGTPYYLSPEICKGLPYGYKSDMWSLGCILYELCTLTRAFSGSNVGEVVQKILKHSPPQIGQKYSQPILFLVDNLLRKSPNERMTAEEITNIPTIKNIITDMFDMQGMTTMVFNETNFVVEESSPEDAGASGNTGKTLTDSSTVQN